MPAKLSLNSIADQVTTGPAFTVSGVYTAAATVAPVLQYGDGVISTEEWNAAHVNSLITLSNGGLTATDAGINAVIPVATGTAAATNSLVTSLDNTSLNLPTGTTALLAFLTIGEEAIVPTGLSVHWDSAGTNQAMTLITSVQSSANTNVFTLIYGLVNPTVGAKTLHAAWTNGCPAVLNAIAFSGTVTSSVAAAFTNAATNNGLTTAPTLSVTSASGNMAVASVGADSTALSTLTATGYSNIFVQNQTQFGAIASRAPGASTVAFTGSPAATTEWGAVGCSVVAADTSAFHPGFAQLGVSSGKKVYWETVQTFGSANASVGIGNLSSSAATGQRLGAGADTIGYRTDGTVWNNGSQVATWAAPGTGSNVRVCHAYDSVNNKYWTRVGAAGNWNNDVLANQNPATNTGGLAVPAAVQAQGSAQTAAVVVPAFNTYAHGDTVTGVFASASFAGTPPSGFSPVASGATVFGALPSDAVVPGPVTPPPQNFSFSHPPITTAGTYPVTVRDANSGASATTNVVVATGSGAVTSPDGTTLNSTTGTIYDATSPTPIAWTLQTSVSNGLQIYRNGTLDTNSANVVLLLWYGGSIYQEAGTAAPYHWWVYTGVGADPWSAVPGDPRTPVTTPAVTDITLSKSTVAAGAPAGTVVGNITVVMNTGSFTGTFGALTGTDAAKFKIVGSQLQTTQSLAAGSYAITIHTSLNGATFQKDFTITAASTAGTVTDINLSNNTITAGQPSGTVVGNVLVSMSSGSFTGTLALSGTNAADFSIDVQGRLVTAASLSAADYSFTITSTLNGTTFPKNFTVHVVSAGVQPRPEAIDAGFTTMVVQEDFDSPSAVSTSGPGSIATFYNFNPNSTQLTSSDYNITSSVLTITNSYDPSAFSLGTVAGPNAAKSEPGAIVPNTGNGVAYKYGYFEAKIKFDPSLVDNVNGQPAFWATSLESNITDTQTSNIAEIDVMECFGNSINDASGGVINWLLPSNRFSADGITVAAYGCLFGNGLQGTPSATLMASAGLDPNNYNIWSVLWEPGRIRMWINSAANRAANGYASDTLMLDLPTNQVIPCAWCDASISQQFPGTGMYDGADAPSHNNFILGTGANVDLHVDYFYAWQ